jgi:hypothetical protein
MGSLGPTHLFSLLVAVAIIGAICGFVASAVTRRNKRRARRFFLLGFFCGLITGTILRERRRGTGRFAVRKLSFAASHVRPGWLPAQWNRQMTQRLPLGCGPSLGAAGVRIVIALTQRMSAWTANSLARPPRPL